MQVEPLTYPYLKLREDDTENETMILRTPGGLVPMHGFNCIDSIHVDWYPFFFGSGVNFNARLKKLFSTCYSAGMTSRPKPEEVFSVFSMSPKKIKVVLVAQDPYPGWDNEEGRPVACGRSFATLSKETPASLHRIKSAIMDIFGKITISDRERPNSLQGWVDQGVFLLNNTPVYFAPRSEKKKFGTETADSPGMKAARNAARSSWGGITEMICKFILETSKPSFILVGKEAEYLRQHVSKSIVTNHPSTRSDLDFTGKCFEAVPEVDWTRM